MWTKNGSIPQEQTDGTEGWLDVGMPPAPVDGKEIAWINWQWVIRDPKPTDRDGYRWKWNHDAMQWIEYQLPNIVTIETSQISVSSSADIPALTSEQISGL